MPKTTLPLTEIQVEKAAATDKPVKFFDGKGLYLLISPTKNNGISKCWRLKYRFQGKERLLSLGIYPEVSLSEARIRREQARLLLANNQDPGDERKQEKAAQKALASNANTDPSVKLIMGGGVEIRKGRTAIQLTGEESQFLAELLNKLR